jgi:hypothetical protein
VTNYYSGHYRAAGYGSFFYDGATNNPSEVAHYTDLYGDSYGAYVRANFQEWQYICGNEVNCSFQWGGIVQKASPHIGTSDGQAYWASSTSRLGTSWRDRAEVCTDIPLHTDPCTATGIMYP